MVSYQNCSGCKWFRVASFGIDCTATFQCKHQTDPRPYWVDEMTAPPSHSVTVRPAGYRTPEDRLREIERRVGAIERRLEGGRGAGGLR